MHNEADTVAEHEYLNNQGFFLHQNEHSLNRRVLRRNIHSLQISRFYALQPDAVPDGVHR